MKIVRVSAIFVLGALLASAASASAPAILYSPDSIVDLEASASYVEPSIAADPAKTNTLVAASSSASFGRANLYVSDNGGYDWRASALPLGGVAPLGDVEVAAGPKALYFAFLGGQTGYAHGGIQFFTSIDHGNTFAHTAFVYGLHSYDHEQLTVDTGNNRYRGRIMMSALYSVKETPQVNACGLVWSDDGRTFHGPVRVVTGWCFNSKPVVLANGRILFPYIFDAKFGDRVAKIEVAISRDGGLSFGRARVVGTYTTLPANAFIARLRSGEADFDGDPVPQFASYGNAAYAVWSDLATGTSRLLFSRSTDGGVHWSAPRALVPPPSSADAQYQASIDVNAGGTIAIAFLRATASAGTFQEMLTASTDGGRTFMPPVTLSSSAARLDAMAHSGYGAAAEPVQGQIFVGFSSPGSRFPSGGDYVGMAVDASGAFHPVWVDARTGTDQVWTATARVGSVPAVPPLQQTNVGTTVGLQFGNGSWDPATQTFAVPVRLHNSGTRPLYPPLTVTVRNVHDPWAPGSEKYDSPPIFANATNGETGVGATFVYTSAQLGSLGVLAPGADSAPLVWRVRLPHASVQSSMVTTVDGNVAR